MNEIEQKRLEILLRHIKNVRENTEILGQRLIEQGEDRLGRELIANGLIHDNSKLYGIEWSYLHQDVKDSEPELFKIAAEQHVKKNLHHAEAWVGGIKEMSRVYVAEMVCDWKARSSEFGDDIWNWVDQKAAKKFGYNKSCKVYKEIKDFLTLLLEEKFK